MNCRFLSYSPSSSISGPNIGDCPIFHLFFWNTFLMCVISFLCFLSFTEKYLFVCYWVLRCIQPKLKQIPVQIFKALMKHEYEINFIETFICHSVRDTLIVTLKQVLLVLMTDLLLTCFLFIPICCHCSKLVL